MKQDFSEDDEHLMDPEAPDPADQDADDEPEVMPCPYCGKMVHEQTEWCHHCGKYLSEEDRSTQVPKWIVVGTALGLFAMVGWILIWLLR